jgi:hypothetical protein
VNTSVFLLFFIPAIPALEACTPGLIFPIVINGNMLAKKRIVPPIFPQMTG